MISLNKASRLPYNALNPYAKDETVDLGLDDPGDIYPPIDYGDQPPPGDVGPPADQPPPGDVGPPQDQPPPGTVGPPTTPPAGGWPTDLAGWMRLLGIKTPGGTTPGSTDPSGGLLSLLLPLLMSGGGALNNLNNTKDATRLLTEASTNASNQARGLIDPAMAKYKPYEDAGIDALNKMKGLNSNLSANYKPLGSGAALANYVPPRK